jgi:8-oxo-dGTP pyrophosphatase MutT (NUDIX family)
MTGMNAASEFTWDDQVAVRRVHFHDPDAPAATIVTPSVFVAVHDEQGRFLLVQRCDSGAWEFPGGRMDVGETAIAAAVRETAEEAGMRVRITGLVGLFSDPAFVIQPVAARSASRSSCASTAWPSGDPLARTISRPPTPAGSNRRRSRR